MLKLKEKLQRIKDLSKRLYVNLRYLAISFVCYNFLIVFYILDLTLFSKLRTSKYLPRAVSQFLTDRFYRTYVVVTRVFDSGKNESISKQALINLSLKSMRVKKIRTAIAIGGVSIGIGAIVFLVSIGFGVQRLVISRVARLDELKQADVVTQAGSQIRINDKTLSDIKGFTNVEDVHPVIAAVGRVNYQNSISDMAVYGVTSGYLEKSAIQPIQGKIFESNEISFKGDSSIEKLEKEGDETVASAETDATSETVSDVDGGTEDESAVLPAVQGASSIRKTGEFGQLIAEINFNIEPDVWLRLRESPSTSSNVIGYTKRVENIQSGEHYYGSSYDDEDYGEFAIDSEGETLGIWIKSKVYVWLLKEGEYIQQTDDNGNPIQKEGYVASIGIQEQSPVFTYKNNSTNGDVLGDNIVATTEVLAVEDVADDVATTANTDATTEDADPLSAIDITADEDWVEIVDDTLIPQNQVRKVLLSTEAKKVAVVNRAMLALLNISEEEAVGKKFSTSFVIPSDLISDNSRRIESEPAEYEIVGVTPDDASPVFYVPFVDLRSLGISNFSQFKVLVNDTEDLPLIRKQIEAIGYSTQSVVDTVDQITSLFSTVRLILGVMGMIALAVASLGMFNTLTVSLLERTREVGLMKAMGMTTQEVQELFLIESLIMGFFAGFGGLLLGFIGGKGVGVILSLMSVFKGQGFIDVAYIPFSFVVIIGFLSFLVGLLTGIYPAKRSKSISALDALRYE